MGSSMKEKSKTQMKTFVFMSKAFSLIMLSPLIPFQRLGHFIYHKMKNTATEKNPLSQAVSEPNLTSSFLTFISFQLDKLKMDTAVFRLLWQEHNLRILVPFFFDLIIPVLPTRPARMILRSQSSRSPM
jgi:hypothetical protein